MPMPILSKKWAKLDKSTLEKHNFPKYSLVICPKTTLHFCKNNHYHLMYVVGQLEAKVWPWQDNDWG
jgi:hypothetical protein